MKKTWPKEWLSQIEDCLDKVHGYIRSGCCYSKRQWCLDLLDDLDAAGILKEPPQPLEIEWCKTHDTPGEFADNRCIVSVQLQDDTPCQIVKMREVETRVGP